MSDFLAGLMEREQGRVGAVAPRLPSLHEAPDHDPMFPVFGESPRPDADQGRDRFEVPEAPRPVDAWPEQLPEATETALRTPPASASATASHAAQRPARVDTHASSRLSGEFASSRGDDETGLPAAHAPIPERHVERNPQDAAAFAPAIAPLGNSREPAPARDRGKIETVTKQIVSADSRAEAEAHRLVAAAPRPAALALTPAVAQGGEPGTTERGAMHPRENLLRTADGVAEQARAAETGPVIASPRVSIALEAGQERAAPPAINEARPTHTRDGDGHDVVPALPRYTDSATRARREPPATKAEPTIQVTIGRVEVRAVTAPTAPARGRAAPQPLSLDEYLGQRKQREAR